MRSFYNLSALYKISIVVMSALKFVQVVSGGGGHHGATIANNFNRNASNLILSAPSYNTAHHSERNKQVGSTPALPAAPRPASSAKLLKPEVKSGVKFKHKKQKHHNNNNNNYNKSKHNSNNNNKPIISEKSNVAAAAKSTATTAKWFLPQSFNSQFDQLATLFDSNQLHLSNYNFLFNAERHTVFQLHTIINNHFDGGGNNNNNINRKKMKRTPSQQPTDGQRQKYRRNSTNHNRTNNTINATNSSSNNNGHTNSTMVNANRRRPNAGGGGDDVQRFGVGSVEQQVLNFLSRPIGTAINSMKSSSDVTRVMATRAAMPATAASSSSSPPAAVGAAAPSVARMNSLVRMEEVQLYNATSLRHSHFNPFNPTRILIHGWFGGLHSGIFQSLVPEYLRLDSGNYNVFTVNWGRGAFADYLTASYRVKPVGQTLAKFIDFLHAEAGMRFEDLHLIGFSMGAHIAGIAGKYVQTGRVPLIYALDPALPFFRYDAYDERLSITDAAYVEVIHTNAGFYGYDRPLGHVDFYMNYGNQQPGCFLNECSHMRAYQVFAESLQTRHAFRGSGCDVQLWSDMMRHRRCLSPTGLSMWMGGDDKDVLKLRGRGGIYNVDTNANAPYARF